MFIVISGLPGTGKSAVATALAVRLIAVHVSVDPIEDALLGAGLPRSWQTGVAAYEAARAVAEQNLAAGVAPLFLLLELADEAEHRRRLEHRVRGLAHVPEPTWDDVRARAGRSEPWPEGGCIRLDAAQPVDRLVELVLAAAGG